MQPQPGGSSSGYVVLEPVLGKAHGSLRRCFHSQCLLCTSSWSRPGPARAAEAWTSTATAHGLVTAVAGEGPGPASPAVSPPDPSHTGLPSPSPVRLCGQLHSEVLGAHRVWHWSPGDGAQAPRATSRANLTIVLKVSNLGILSCQQGYSAVRKLRTGAGQRQARCQSPPCASLLPQAGPLGETQRQE